VKERDYRDFNKAMSDDFLTYVNNHPDAIDVLLFRPDTATLEKTAVTTDVVGALESEERAMEYLDPIIVKAVIIPDAISSSAVDAGGEPDGAEGQPVIMLIGADVPKQSVVQYREYINDTDVRMVSLYVLRSEIVGEAPGVCERHYCVPFHAFDYEFIEQPVNDAPDDGAVGLVLMPTLSASEFIVHGANDTHTKSRWQVRAAAGTYDLPIYDSGESVDLRTHIVPVGLLSVGQTYYWHVRYRGADGDVAGEVEIWSDWSNETRFATMEVF